MNKDIAILNQEDIKNRIYTIRGVQVILDSDLATLYEVETRRLNEQVKRNNDRFPLDFMFQLTKGEFENLMSQNATSRLDWGGRRKLPYVFTEPGVASLSGVLTSKKAIEVNVQVIRAFVAMRRFISKNAEIFVRLNTVERKHIEYDKNFEKIFNAIESKKLIPNKGIFFDGQIFDAYNFVSDLIRSAKESIVLIDNFVDDSVLTLFSKRRGNVGVVIYTKTITKQLRLDLNKYNSQYPEIEIKEFKKSHDRFMIIDNKEVYHIGASLKDLGKKWFAFSKFDKDVLGLLGKLG